MVGPLQVDAVSYHRGGRQVLDRLSLQLSPGDLVGLLGPNGAGKSSLLRLMMGLATPDDGIIRLHGRPLAAWGRAALARELGYLPQAHVAAFPYTVSEIVGMGRLVQHGWWRRPSRQDRWAVDQAMDRLGIHALAARAYTELSGGERQSVLIARAVAQGCRILLLDEPAASLDYGQQCRLYALLRMLAEQGYAILASSHDPQQARSAFDQVILMRQGRGVGHGPANEMLSDAAVRRLYDLPSAGTLHDGLAGDCPPGGGQD